LGLAIAAELVRAHGGSISAGNADRLGGAWVRVWLPRLVRGEAGEPDDAAIGTRQGSGEATYTAGP